MVESGDLTRRYIVGTHSFLLVVDVDHHWTVYGMTRLAEGHHYGIAPSDDGGFYAKGGRGERITKYVPAGSGYVSTASWLLGDRFKYVHQIALHRDALWLANTDFNAVDVQHVGRSGSSRRMHYRGATTDRNHVNSLFPCGDVVFTLLNNKGRIPSQVVALPASGELRELHAMSLWDTGCHNVFLDRDRLLYNASGRGHFVAVDLERQRVERRQVFRGHTKGLSVTNDDVVIGVSDHASRSDRFGSRGHLAVVGRRDLDVVALIDLNAALGRNTGNVNEVRRIDVPDEAHAPAPTSIRADWRSLRLSDGDHIYRTRFRVRRAAMDARNFALHRRPWRRDSVRVQLPNGRGDG